jgi:hypothetical protein
VGLVYDGGNVGFAEMGDGTVARCFEERARGPRDGACAFAFDAVELDKRAEDGRERDGAAPCFFGWFTALCDASYARASVAVSNERDF